MDFRVLGPPVVVDGERTIALGATREAALLVLLLVHGDETLSTGRLIDELWAADPTPGAATTVHGYIHNLRRALEPDRPPGTASEVLVTRRPGYALVVGADGSDARRFERLAAEAHGALARGRASAATDILGPALALWRGPALGEFASEPFARVEAARLEELRLVAIEDRVEARLRLGHHASLVAELEALVCECPLREPLWGQLMLALYRSGRQADALRAYGRLRTILDDELGIEPGGPVRDLEAAILLHKPELDWHPEAEPASAPRAAPRPSVVRLEPLPAALAADLTPMVGRRVEMEWLEVLWQRAIAGEPQLALIGGPAGIGKSRLAAEFARRAHARGARVVFRRGSDAPAARERPHGELVLLVLDDPDVENLSVAAMGFAGTSAMIIVTTRETTVDEADDPSTDEPTRNARVLSGLSVDETAALLATRIGPRRRELAEAVREETAGVPALLLEMADALRQREVAQRLERTLTRAGLATEEQHTAEHELVDDLVGRTEVARRFSTDDARATCPYKGLAAFDTADAPRFFGRERVVATLVGRLATSRFVAVVGASGSGKSSVVRAGLLPALAGGALPGSESWRAVVCTPGVDPFASVACALSPVLGAPSAQLAAQLVHEPAHLGSALHAGAYARVVLVIDQFEELVTLCPDPDTHEVFATALTAAVGGSDGSLVVVVVARADYYGALASLPSLSGWFESSQVVVGAMTDGDLWRAVTLPARDAGLTLDDGLADVVCADAFGEPGALPLVSTALLETWARREHDRLTVAGYEAAGGVRGALARLADDAFATLDSAQQGMARRLFLRLAEPGAGVDDVRRRAPRDELVGGEDVERVLEAFVQRRLLVAGEGYVEVAHEVLLREWPRLRAWLEEDREGRRLHRRLTEASVAWDAEGREASALYRGARLAAAQEWVGSHPEEPNPLEREFLNASSGAQRDLLGSARRSARRLRALAGGLALLLVVAVIASALAIVQRRRASDEAARARAATLQAQASRLAALARSLGSDEADLALLLGVEAPRLVPSVDTEGALQAALVHVTPGLEQSLRLVSPTYIPDLSADGRRLAVPDEDRSVEIWDLAAGRKVGTLSGPTAAPTFAFFNADASLVADGRSDGSVRVWDASTGRQEGAPLQAGGSGAYGRFLDAEGDRMFTATVTSPTPKTAEGRVVVWDRHDPAHPQPVGEPITIRIQPGANLAAEASADRRLLATSGAPGGSTELWDIARGAVSARLPGAFGGFAPDGNGFATVEGSHVSLWDSHTGQRLGRPFPDLPLAARSGVVFSGDGRLLAVTDDILDGRVWVFDVASRTQVGVLALGLGGSPVAFLADGRLVTATGPLVQVWRLGVAVPPIGTALGPPAGGVEGQFTAAGAEVDTWGAEPATAEHPMMRWDGTSGAALGPLLAGRAHPTGFPFAVAPDPAGTAVAVAGADGKIGVWDRLTGEEVAVLDGHRGGELAAFWSPGGSRVATIGLSQSVLVWDVSDLHHPVLSSPPLAAPGGPPPPSTIFASRVPWLTAAFTHDGRHAVVVDRDQGSVTLFDVATGRAKWSASFPNPNLQFPNVGQVAFTPDDTVLAVQSTADPTFSNATLTVLDVATGAARRTPVPSGSGVGVAFLAGGREFVTTSGTQGSQVALLWDMATLTRIGEPMPAGAIGGLLTGCGCGVYVDVSPDGKRFVTQGVGTTLGPVLWDTDPTDWAATACRIAGRNLTRAEWQQYLPGRPYHVTCPQWPPGT